MSVERLGEPPWDFEDWFAAQHGPRPGGGEGTEHLRDRVQSMRAMLATDEAILLAREKWESRHTSALYAWQIKDTQKEGSR